MFLLLLPATIAFAFIHRVGAAVPIACLCSVGLVLDRAHFAPQPAGEG